MIILRLKPTALFVSVQVFEMVIRSLSPGYADTNSRATIKTHPDIRQACQVLMQWKLLAIQKPQTFVGLLAHRLTITDGDATRCCERIFLEPESILFFLFKTSGNCFFLFTERAKPLFKTTSVTELSTPSSEQATSIPFSASVIQLFTSSEITTKIEKRLEK